MDKRNISSWVAVILTAIFSCFWAFWGIIENFHEGWYYSSIWMNLGLMLAQYLFFTIIFILLGFAGIRFPRTGSILILIVAAAIPLFRIRSFAAIVTFSLPLLIIAVLFYFGKMKNKKFGYIITFALPLAVIIGFGVEPAIRVSQRVDDGNYQSRLVEGNGVKLVWAPMGPGWITETSDMTGKKWADVSYICAHLTDDGKSLSDSAMNIWRLPTIEEAVASLTRGGSNAGGIWSKVTNSPHYNVLPDKESPLWKVNSPIIYWWTATELDDSTAYRIVYNGSVQSLKKKTIMGSLGFRAVKKID